jgi:hypothetical protein
MIPSSRALPLFERRSRDPSFGRGHCVMEGAISLMPDTQCCLARHMSAWGVKAAPLAMQTCRLVQTVAPAMSHFADCRPEPHEGIHLPPARHRRAQQVRGIPWYRRVRGLLGLRWEGRQQVYPLQIGQFLDQSVSAPSIRDSAGAQDTVPWDLCDGAVRDSTERCAVVPQIAAGLLARRGTEQQRASGVAKHGMNTAYGDCSVITSRATLELRR